MRRLHCKGRHPNSSSRSPPVRAAQGNRRICGRGHGFDAKRLQSLLRPYPPDEMEAYPIRTLVNNPRNERKKCVEPLTAS